MARTPTAQQRAHYVDLRRSFKRIEEYTEEDLDSVIACVPYDHPEAFTILNFIDCYFERRARKRATENGK